MTIERLVNTEFHMAVDRRLNGASRDLSMTVERLVNTEFHMAVDRRLNGR